MYYLSVVFRLFIIVGKHFLHPSLNIFAFIEAE